MLKTLPAWLGLGDTPAAAEPAPLRELLDALDRLDGPPTRTVRDWISHGVAF